MPRRPGQGPRQALFDRLLAERPNADPLQLAREAGFARPERFVKQRAERNARARAQAAQAQPPADDRELSKQALRTLVQLGDDRSQIRAASELLKHSPAATNTATERAIVIFRGRDDSAGARVVGIDPESVVAAAQLAKSIELHGRDEALKTHAEQHAIDVEELSCAWYAWSIPSVQAAALEALKRHDPTLTQEPQ